jgi:hypothetical protein
MWRTSILALAAALALAACGSSQSTSATGNASSSTPSQTSSPTTSGSTANARTTSKATLAGTACTSAQLRLTYVGTEGATGHLEVTLALHNTSSTSCTVKGYPGARLLNDRGGALPLTVKRGGGFFPDSQRRAETVTLKPGGRARFGVSFVTNNEYAGAHVCHTATAAMSSAPGAAGHWLKLSLHGAPKVAPCGDQLVVSPLYA